MLKILTFSTLYPNMAQPIHGIFVERRLQQLVGSGMVSARVVAPVPWFPWSHPRFGRYAELARVPHHESRSGVDVTHPRYPLLPKIGMSSAPLLLAAATRGELERIRHAGFDFDLIDAHYFYPDGVAAILLGRWLGRPVVITGRGTDLNLIPRYVIPRAWLRWAAPRAAGVITVSAALRRVALELGVDERRAVVLPNGVELERFTPQDRTVARARIGVGATGVVLLAVGHLIERKGHHLIIEALPRLPGVELVIVGEGEERSRLEELARRLGVERRVRLVGARPQEELPWYYSAADLLILASSREGWANVLLEAMACGTAVAATAVWGAPELITDPAAGWLLAERTPAAIVAAVESWRAHPPQRTATRAFAEGFSWEATTRGQLELFNQVVAAHRAAPQWD